MAWRRLRRFAYERFVRPVLFVKDSPRSKAGGVALGAFVGMIPIVGFQMPIAFVVATVFGVNQPLAVALCGITNPFTFAPIYYGEYLLGSWLLGVDAIASQADFMRHWEATAATHAGTFGRVVHFAGEIGTPLLLGAIVAGAAAGLAGWCLTLRLCLRRERLRLPVPPSSASLVTLVLAALLLTTCTCSDSTDRFSTHEPQVEARLEGEIELRYAWLEGDTLLVVAPIHAADSRNRFSQARLAELTRTPPPSLWVAIELWRFGGEAPLELGSDGLSLIARSPRGSVTSLPPSKLVAAVEDPGARPVIAALTGATALPALSKGRSLHLVAALPTGASLAELDAVAAKLRSGTIDLEPARAPALQWDEFRTAPTRAGFAALIGLPQAAAAAPAEGGPEEGHDEDEPEPQK